MTRYSQLFLTTIFALSAPEIISTLIFSKYQDMGSLDRDNNTGYQPTEPTPCANGCGFFGAPATKGLCSKCYRQLLFEQESAVSAISALQKLSPKQGPADAAADVEISTAEKAIVDEESTEPQAKAKAAAKNRCSSCKKKVGLLGFECRCGGTFCGAHRYAEKHCCTFDFKGFGRGEIEKANPVVKADKIDRI